MTPNEFSATSLASVARASGRAVRSDTAKNQRAADRVDDREQRRIAEQKGVHGLRHGGVTRGGAFARPWLDRLERGGGLQHAQVVEALADDLQARLADRRR